MKKLRRVSIVVLLFQLGGIYVLNGIDAYLKHTFSSAWFVMTDSLGVAGIVWLVRGEMIDIGWMK